MNGEWRLISTFVYEKIETVFKTENIPTIYALYVKPNYICIVSVYNKRTVYQCQSSGLNKVQKW